MNQSHRVYREVRAGHRVGAVVPGNDRMECHAKDRLCPTISPVRAGVPRAKGQFSIESNFKQ